MNRLEKSSNICGAVLVAASFLLLFISRKNRIFAEWYATHIYPGIVKTVGRFFGMFPFSVVEILLYFVLAMIIFAIARILVVVIKKESCQTKIISLCRGVVIGASVLFFLYTVNCGINYQRMTFSELEDMEIVPYSTQELIEVCTLLTEDVNKYGEQVQRDDEGLAKLTIDEKAEAVVTMNHMGQKYVSLKGYYPKPKSLLVSWILSVQSLTGVYAPFTVEANYNNDMIAYNKPFTTCHELSHLRGFMEEKEANFIAYLACMESEEPDFRYSGSLLGWIYCTNVLYEIDHDAWKEIHDQLSDDVKKDLKENSKFWERYEGKISEVSDKVNDNYLKANGQADGVKSYDKMVDLLVSYYLQKNK